MGTPLSEVNVKSLFAGKGLEISFNRPDKKNAITQNMYHQMATALSGVYENASIKVVIISGQGGNFTAGNDLGDFLKNPCMEKGSPVYDFLQSLVHCPVPVLMAVEGYAIGIGSTMLLHSEQVFASREAVFAMPFVNLGLVPEAGSSLLLPRIAGYQRAADILLMGEVFDADMAKEIGLVSRITEPESALKEAVDYAEKLIKKPKEALVQTKKLLRRDTEALSARLEIELELFVASLSSSAAQEAMSAFLEKRKPDFSNL